MGPVRKGVLHSGALTYMYLECPSNNALRCKFLRTKRTGGNAAIVQLTFLLMLHVAECLCRDGLNAKS